jgi:hypothetical protein
LPKNSLTTPQHPSNQPHNNKNNKHALHSSPAPFHSTTVSTHAP